jgi:hypothetical protein
MLRFEFLEFGHHAVELHIGNFRFVQNEVEIFVTAQLVPQLFDLLGNGRVAGHESSKRLKKRAFSIQCAPAGKTGRTRFP